MNNTGRSRTDRVRKPSTRLHPSLLAGALALALLSPAQAQTASEATPNNGLLFVTVVQNGVTLPNTLWEIQQRTDADGKTTVWVKTSDFGQAGLAPMEPASDNLAAAVPSQTTLSITCPNGTPWQVGLNNGQNFTGTTRRMRHSTANAWISYGLARTTAWGNTIGTNTLGGTGNGSTQTLTIYGQTPAQPVSAPGTYQDTITVTLTYWGGTGA